MSIARNEHHYIPDKMLYSTANRKEADETTFPSLFPLLDAVGTNNG
jgi:hypothetical protein